VIFPLSALIVPAADPNGTILTKFHFLIETKQHRQDANCARGCQILYMSKPGQELMPTLASPTVELWV
jgi:hypothetical protein